MLGAAPKPRQQACNPTQGYLRNVLPVCVVLVSVLCINQMEQQAMRELDDVEAGLLEDTDPFHAPDSSQTNGNSRWVSEQALAGRPRRGVKRDSVEVHKSMQSSKNATPPSKTASSKAPSSGPVVRAPKPVIFDLSSAERQAAGLLGAGLGLGIGGRPPPPGVAWPMVEVPEPCFNGLGYNKTQDGECYWVMDALFQKEKALDVNYPYCWGKSSSNGRLPPNQPPVPASSLLFHTVLLDVNPLPLLPLFYWSFLSTQCCDAALWVWTKPEALEQVQESLTALNIPKALAARILVKKLDVAEAWASVKPLFPSPLPADADAAAKHLASQTQKRKSVEWACLLVLARWGGVYLDPDHLLLRDWRPLFNITRFGTRSGFNIFISDALLRLPALPDPVTSRTLATVLAKRQTGGSIMIGEKDAIGMAKLGARDWVALLSINLFDSIWIRYLGSRHEHFSMYSVHPELSRDRAWDDFFEPSEGGEVMSRMVTEPFMRGSFAWHFHAMSESHGKGESGRYALGMRPGSWAGALVRRFEEMARQKAVICESG